MTQEIDDGEMNAGYDDETTPAAKPEIVEKVEPVAEVTQEPIDPMKVLMDRFEKLESRTRNAEGHIGGLNHKQKVLDETFHAAKAATEQVRSAPSQAQVNEAIENPVEWNELKNDFPEWATATEKFMDAKLASVKPKDFDMSPIDKLVEERIAKQAANYSESIQNVSMFALETAFPGWKDDINTPEFSKWQAAQPAEIQKLGASEHVADAAKMLKLFQSSKKPEPSTVKPDTSMRAKRFEAAVTPRGSGGLNSSTKTELDEMEAGYR